MLGIAAGKSATRTATGHRPGADHPNGHQRRRGTGASGAGRSRRRSERERARSSARASATAARRSASAKSARSRSISWRSAAPSGAPSGAGEPTAYTRANSDRSIRKAPPGPRRADNAPDFMARKMLDRLLPDSLTASVIERSPIKAPASGARQSAPYGAP